MGELALNEGSLMRKKLIPPRPVHLEGVHELVLKAWVLTSIPGEKNGRKKLEMHWQTSHEGQLIIIRDFYNIDVLKNGSLFVGWSSKLMRHYAALFGYPNKQTDISPDHFAGCLVKARLRLVSKGRGGVSIRGKAQYAVVDELLELIAGG